MKRGRISAIIGALSLTLALGVAAPANAATVTTSCADGSQGLAGSTEGDAQITFLAGVGWTHCGTLGIRVNYSHVGGSSWTGWKYSPYAGGHVTENVGNSALRSDHYASVGPVNWSSYR